MHKHFAVCLSFLEKKFIKIQHEWLDACIEWIIEENKVRSLLLYYLLF